MKVLLIGSEGSMGKRYQAILNYLNIEYIGVDDYNAIYTFETFSHFIIASPTDTHFEWIKMLRNLNKPILCEKPLTKSKEELDRLKEWVNDGLDLEMVMQYQYLPPEIHYKKGSLYNYYNTGKDGIVWDCIQIIGLSSSKLIIKNTSPIWICAIDHTYRNLVDMDASYVLQVKDWLKGIRTPFEEVYETHIKVHKFMETSKKIEGGYEGTVE